MTEATGTDPEHRIRREFLDRLDPKFAIRTHYENVLEQMYRPLLTPGMTVYDIGCHAGRHAWPFLELVGPTGRVEGFEPLPAMAPALRQLARDRPAFRLHQIALADQNGRTEFVFADGAPEESGLRARAFNRPELVQPTKIAVTVRRLDDYAPEMDLDDPDFIKIDVEGAEMDLLAGAATLLARARPLVSVEYGGPGFRAYGREPQDLWDFAQGAGFALFDIFGYRIAGAADWNAVVDAGSWDWFMVPEERAAAVAAVWA